MPDAAAEVSRGVYVNDLTPEQQHLVMFAARAIRPVRELALAEGYRPGDLRLLVGPGSLPVPDLWGLPVVESPEVPPGALFVQVAGRRHGLRGLRSWLRENTSGLLFGWLLVGFGAAEAALGLVAGLVVLVGLAYVIGRRDATRTLRQRGIPVVRAYPDAPDGRPPSE